VLIQKLDFTIQPLFSLLVTASIASLYFNLINKNNLKNIYQDCFSNKKSWLEVMVIVLIMWATTMIGPGQIGASLFNFIYFAWLGMLGLLSLSIKHSKHNRINLYFSISIFLLLSANIFFELHQSFSRETIYGTFFAILGGTASFIYFKKSQALAKNASLSATQVLAVRFYLAIVVLMFLLPKHNVASYLTITNVFSLILLAFFSLIIPLYFSQKALETITPEQHAIINSTCPIVTGILQELIFKDISMMQMAIYFSYTFIILSLYLIKKSANRSVLAA
jgi:hypothetical protein